MFTGRAKIDPILEVVGGFAVGGVISFASWRILNGDMQVGDVVAFVTTLILLVQPVRAIGTLNAILQEALAAGERIFKLLDAPRLIVDRPDAIELRVKKGNRFDKVCFSYQKANNDIGDEKDLVGTLKDVSFTVKSGQSVALVGPSGSGKTTVMNLLPRFDPDSGAIFIDEKSIAKVKIEFARINSAC